MAFDDCPDCYEPFVFSFTLALEDAYTVVSFGNCENCHETGDSRSLRAKTKIKAKAWIEAVNRGLPVVNFGTRRNS